MLAKQLRQQSYRNFPGLLRERSPPWSIRCGLEQAQLVEPRASSRIGHQHLPSPIRSDAELLSRWSVMLRRSPQTIASVPGGPLNKHADSPSPAFANRLRNRTSIAESRSNCVSLSLECGSDTLLPRTCAALRAPGLRGQTAGARDTEPCDVQFGGSCVVGLYHEERNHQGLENRLIEPVGRDESTVGPIQCVQRLGGMLRFYRRAAA